VETCYRPRAHFITSGVLASRPRARGHGFDFRWEHCGVTMGYSKLIACFSASDIELN